MHFCRQDGSISYFSTVLHGDVVVSINMDLYMFNSQLGWYSLTQSSEGQIKFEQKLPMFDQIRDIQETFGLFF